MERADRRVRAQPTRREHPDTRDRGRNGKEGKAVSADSRVEPPCGHGIETGREVPLIRELTRTAQFRSSLAVESADVAAHSISWIHVAGAGHEPWSPPARVRRRCCPG